jgi:hypothetical protein
MCLLLCLLLERCVCVELLSVLGQREARKVSFLARLLKHVSTDDMLFGSDGSASRVLLKVGDSNSTFPTSI